MPCHLAHREQHRFARNPDVLTSITIRLVSVVSFTLRVIRAYNCASFANVLAIGAALALFARRLRQTVIKSARPRTFLPALLPLLINRDFRYCTVGYPNSTVLNRPAAKLQVKRKERVVPSSSSFPPGVFRGRFRGRMCVIIQRKCELLSEKSRRHCRGS